ncbi:hypothetical protein [Pseudomonas putida]|uniref:hypothetical protein n=1 Tax=Pseudomonas putida TaxID=303 RepID=UPI001147619E|nr:hypothetical protein [Pseudomonas putida]
MRAADFHVRSFYSRNRINAKRQARIRPAANTEAQPAWTLDWEVMPNDEQKKSRQRNDTDAPEFRCPGVYAAEMKNAAQGGIFKRFSCA